MLTGDLLTGASADWRDELEDRGAGDDVLRLLGACLASKAEKRPASAAVLAEELSRLRPAADSPPPSQLISMLPPLAPAPPTVLTPKPRRIVQPNRSLPKQLTNLLGMKFVLIPAGTFVMGSPPDEAGRGADEGPQHEVTIARPFYLAIYPVTQAHYQRVTRGNPSHFCRSGRGKELCKDLDPQTLPVERVTWGNAVVFCRKLSEWPEEQRHGRKYRLPTEAEWEYACRGDSLQPFHLGLSLSSSLANFDGNYPYGGAARAVSQAYLAGRQLSAQSIGTVRSARQRLGVVRRLVWRALLFGESGRGSARPGDGRSPCGARRLLEQSGKQLSHCIPRQARTGRSSLSRRLSRAAGNVGERGALDLCCGKNRG